MYPPIGKENIDNSKHLIDNGNMLQYTLQKEVKSNPKQPSCKKNVAPRRPL